MARLPATEQVRARRLYEAAVRDANCQIAIISALVNTSQESSKTEYTNSENENSPTTQKKVILDDSYIRPTSDELFARVRRENAVLFGSINFGADLADK